MRDVVYSREAIRTLNRIPANEARRIRAKVLQYAADPASLANNVKKLRDSRYHRLRIGDWRVIFREDEVVVDVVGSQHAAKPMKESFDDNRIILYGA